MNTSHNSFFCWKRNYNLPYLVKNLNKLHLSYFYGENESKTVLSHCKHIRIAKKTKVPFVVLLWWPEQKQNLFSYQNANNDYSIVQFFLLAWWHNVEKKNGKIVQKHKSCWQHISCFLFWKHRSHGHHSHFKVFQIKVYFLKSTSVSKFCTFSDFKDQGTYTYLLLHNPKSI